MKICTHKQFWCKEILFFLGIEDEHEQIELLLQHKNSLPKKKAMYKKLQKELIEHENRLQMGKPPKEDKYQHKENSKDSIDNLMDDYGSGTYMGEIPVILPHEDLEQSILDKNPNHKMIKPLVSGCKVIGHELEYTIAVDYLDGNSWEIIKPFTEIYAHRSKVSRKHQDLSIPVISRSGDVTDNVIKNKRKYEIQEYLDYLLESHKCYTELLDLIEFSRNSRAITYQKHGDISESKESSINSPNNEVSSTSINNPDSPGGKIVGDSFIEDEGMLFQSYNGHRASPGRTSEFGFNNGGREDSDEDF
mmetsp:Transcript_30652/g.30154  ORF Transcript_30652/g.30154 Transcript_30652/m.30154 type:complete len:305 (-) Transcript_30652:18-932(-)